MDSSRLIVVRHAERMDEVSMDHWRERLLSHREQHMAHRSRHPYSERHDTHLTDTGIRQAEEVANHLHGELTAEGVQLQCVYSSRLIRAVQTAHPIAVRFGVPIVLSSAIAECAAAVAKISDSFDFLSAEELQHFAPGVTLVEGDELFVGSDNNNKKIKDSADTEEEEEVVDFCTEVDHEPMTPRWEQYLQGIGRKHPTALVVAHRETIYNLSSGCRVRKVPYCGHAYFTMVPSSGEIKLRHCLDRSGTVVFSPADTDAVCPPPTIY